MEKSKLGTPLGDRVLVRQIDTSETKSSGGIIIQEDNMGFRRGVVVEASEGFISNTGAFMKLQVEVGDTVLFGNGFGTRVRLEGNTYYLINESDILMKL